MRKHWKAWAAGLALVLLLTAGIAAALWWPVPGITAANYERIQLGMTLAEVESLLGEPGVTTGPDGPKGESWYSWEAPRADLGELHITLRIAADGTVCDKSIYNDRVAPEPSWKRWFRLALGG